MIEIRGRPTPEEVAAVVVALHRTVDEPTPYARWRAGRLAALRRTSARAARPSRPAVVRR